MSLAAAREEAARMRKTARSNGDPLAERRQAHRAVPTFEEAARQVHEAHSASWQNPKHRAQWIATLEQYVFPVFGAKRIDHVDTADVLKALGVIWMEKPETARRVRQRIRAVGDWAKASGFRSGDNPVDGVSKVLPKHKTKQEHHAALPYAHVPAFLADLRDCDAGASVKFAFEFLILTATRSSEVLRARWDEIDLEAKTWTIPADRMKAKTEHCVPLAPRSVETLEKAQEISNGEYVFPGRMPNRPLSTMAFNMALRRMNRTDCVPHGFRSSFRDWAAERTNFPREVCEAALAHTLTDKTEAAYNRTTLFERRRELMTTWAAFATAEPGKVVQIRARAKG